MNQLTTIGKVCLIVLIIFRILLIFRETIYIHDDKSAFVCNTAYPSQGSKYPDCTRECYEDAIAPISLTGFWQLYVIMIILPTLGYLIYVFMRRGSNRDVEQDSWMMILYAKPGKEARKAYVFQLLVQATLEAVFLYGQGMMYGLEVVPVECTSPMCALPSIEKTLCKFSRPIEKTMFLRTMYVVGGLSVLLITLEILQMAISGLLNRSALLPSPPDPGNGLRGDRSGRAAHVRKASEHAGPHISPHTAQLWTRPNITSER